MAPNKKATKVTDRVSKTLPPRSASQRADSTVLPLELQQALLNVFKNALPLAEGFVFQDIIQQVKGHLYSRDFATAFGQENFLKAYASRWSASRALAYADIFGSLDIGHVLVQPQRPSETDPPFVTSYPKPRKVVCLGGGAGAELVGLAAIVQQRSLPGLSVSALDVADWTSVLQALHRCITESPPLSPYASQAVKADNRALIKLDQLHVSFKKQDILNMDEDQMRSTLAGASLVTIMFTLNELLTTSTSKSTTFLLLLSDTVDFGCWFLVVDSPGSYSEIALGNNKQTKQYPMKWLLDHVLLEVAGADVNGTKKWRKHMTDDSRWFRIPRALKYPLNLESMRYQIHLFQRQGKEEQS